MSSETTLVRAAASPRDRPESLAPPLERPIDFVTMQRRYFNDLLAYTQGRIYGKDGAAAIAGMPPTTLQSRLKKLGIDPSAHRR